MGYSDRGYLRKIKRLNKGKNHDGTPDPLSEMQSKDRRIIWTKKKKKKKKKKRKKKRKQRERCNCDNGGNARKSRRTGGVGSSGGKTAWKERKKKGKKKIFWKRPPRLELGKRGVEIRCTSSTLEYYCTPVCTVVTRVIGAPRKLSSRCRCVVRWCDRRCWQPQCRCLSPSRNPIIWFAWSVPVSRVIEKHYELQP